MQLAKPVSSLPPTAVIAHPGAVSSSASDSTATPFAALLESHHETQQHSPVPKTQSRTAPEPAEKENLAPVENKPVLSRASTPDRLADRSIERNRLNAQREAKQALNRPATPTNSKVPAPDQSRNTAPSPQDVNAQNTAPAEEHKAAKNPDESSFNPLALLQWISDQTAQPALTSNAITVNPEADEPLQSDEQSEGEPSQRADVVRILSAINNAADTSAASTAQPGVDKSFSTGSGLTSKLQLATVALAIDKLDAPQASNPSGSDKVGANDMGHLGAMGLEGWTRTMESAVAGNSSAGTGTLPKAAPITTVAETSNTPQPFALGADTGISRFADMPTASVNLAAPVQSPEFRELLGSQISLLAKDGVQQAELHLNPAEMGPVSVQITLDGTQARVDFGADSAQTRQFIEASLPELASALRDAGLTLSGGGVSQHAGNRNDQGQTSRAGRNGSPAEVDNAGDALQPPPLHTRRVAMGGVDLYA